MTTWYLDPEGGNDANAGTSFATRRQHINSPTLAAGDTVRIIASLDPISLGSATWTDNSPSVTLAAAVTLTVDNCETAWTSGNANITSTVSGSGRKQGSNALALAIAAAFTTGLMAFKAVSNLDLSAYSCISLWINTGGATLANGVSLALCSDSAGATPIVTLPMPAFMVGAPAGRPAPVLFENGGAALPSGINSIALYAPSGKPFTGTLAVDNIIATKAWGAAGHLSHACLFGKNNVAEPEWYPIMSIDGTAVVLGNLGDFNAAAPVKNYRGITESVTTFALCPLRTRATQPQSTQNAAGTTAAPITWTGGWNRTDMSTQTGKSWLTGENSQSFALISSLSPAWMSLPDSTLGFAGYVTAAFNASSDGGVLHIAGCTSCASPLTRNTSRFGNDLDLGNLVWNLGAPTLSNLAAAQVKLRIRRVTGVPGTALAFNDSWDDAASDILISQIDNNTFALGSSGNSPGARLRGTTFKNNSSGTVNVAGASGCEFEFDRPILGDALIATLSATSGQIIRVTAANGNRWDNRVYTYGATQQVVQSPVHGTTAQSLSILVNDYQCFLAAPYRARIARIACFANKTVTFSANMQRSAQFISAGLMVQAGAVAGIVDASTQGSAANGTWEATSINFTPTEDGVVDVFAYVMAQNNASANGAIAYFGDTSVSST